MIKKRARKVRDAPLVPLPDRAVSAKELPAASAAFVYAEPFRVSGPQAAPTAAPIPVFLVEENRLVADGIIAMLGQHGIRVVATARTAKEALQQVPLLQRHVVLLDSSIREVDSLALVAAIRAASKDVSVVVMDLLPTLQDVSAFVHAGVAGFILKNATEDVFVGTIRAVAGGAHVLPLPLTGGMLAQVAASVQGRGPREVKAAVRMTTREREVVAMVARGATNREIGAKLHIAAHTVKSYLNSIMEKLALHTRLQVAARAKARPARPSPRMA